MRFARREGGHLAFSRTRNGSQTCYVRFAAGKQTDSTEFRTRNGRQVRHMRFAAGQGQNEKQKRDSREKESRKQKKGRHHLPAYICYLVTY